MEIAGEQHTSPMPYPALWVAKVPFMSLIEHKGLQHRENCGLPVSLSLPPPPPKSLYMQDASGADPLLINSQ